VRTARRPPRWSAAPLRAAFALVAVLVASSAAAEPPRDAPAIVRAFPSFARVPRIGLVTKATPLERLGALEQRLRGEQGGVPRAAGWLWVKRDDVSEGLVGGNKARKLEFLLGEAKAAGARGVITSGRLGTNLGLPAALAARRLGLRATVVLAPQPVSEAVRRKLLALYAAGAEMRVHSTLAGAVLDVVWLRLQAALRPDQRLYYIPPSGTSAVGSLGYVNAFFELLEQTGDEGLPDEIVVAASTGGTAAGLIAGMCLSGRWERTRIRAVTVTDGWLQSEWLLRREARDAFRAARDTLDAADRARAVECDFMGSSSALTYVRGYLAPGYGRGDAELDAVMRLARETQGLELDVTFSAKAMRHYLDRARERLRSGDTRRPLLFWNTYAPLDLESVVAAHAWTDPVAPWRDLPEGFHWMFKPSAPIRTAAAPSAAR
jgi:D-cysteine desulfhydrase